jgi:SAM-dependent methyltransferase
MDQRMMEIFLDVQGDLPRQGPGDDASTLRALSLCDGLPEAPRVLDIGCGPGAQTIALANALPDAAITAVDTHAPYLDRLKARADDDADRITTQVADMTALPLAPASFDLLWCEGAAYIMGIDAALRAWRPLLKPGGCLALTELVWLTEAPPTDAAAFFAEEYPAMRGAEAVAALFEDAGYAPRGHFTLPDSAWWDQYYTPLAARLPEMERKYAGDEMAQAIIEMTRKEIAVREKFVASYGYEFYVARKSSSQAV